MARMHEIEGLAGVLDVTDMHTGSHAGIAMTMQNRDKCSRAASIDHNVSAEDQQHRYLT